MGLVFFLGSGLLTGTGAGEWPTGWGEKAGKWPVSGGVAETPVPSRKFDKLGALFLY